MYRFVFQREINGGTEEIELPLAPEQFKTKVGNKNKTIELVSVGEVNIPKDIGLREFSFEILLPKDSTLVTGTKTYLDKDDNVLFANEYLQMNFHEPIWYLSRFRELKADAEPFYFVIIRQLVYSYNADGSINYKYLFGGNLKVTMEDYTVEENAGEEGDYWVDIKLKEYREVGVVKKIEETGEISDIGKIIATEQKQREKAGDIPEFYTVKENDTLWNIAKKYFGDGSKYTTLMKMNNLENANDINVGRCLRLREAVIIHEPTVGAGSFTATPGGGLIYDG